MSELEPSTMIAIPNAPESAIARTEMASVLSIADHPRSVMISAAQEETSVIPASLSRNG